MQLLKNSGKSSAPKDKHRILLFKDIMLVAVLVLPSYSLYFTTATCWYYCACCYYYSSGVPTSYSHSKSALFAVPKYSQGNFRVESLESYFDVQSETNDNGFSHGYTLRFVFRTILKRELWYQMITNSRLLYTLLCKRDFFQMISWFSSDPHTFSFKKKVCGQWLIPKV
jgi:hypothetical protein